MSGELKIGDKLPPERELAKMLNVSRTSVRDALRTLESIGLVEIKRGDGTYLRRLGSEALVQPFISFFATSQAPLQEIFEARLVIEPEVAALAAERAETEDIQALEAALDRQSNDLAVGLPSEDYYTEFHSILARISSNPVVLTLMTTLLDLDHESQKMSNRTVELARQSLRDHRALLEAVRHRQPSVAREVMRQHLETIEHMLTNSEEVKDPLVGGKSQLSERSTRRKRNKGGKKT